MEQQQQKKNQMKGSSAEFEVGDSVSWKYGAGTARGHVVEKLTQDRKLGARTFKASPEEPKYLLKIDKTGKEAIRKGETLERIDEDEIKQQQPQQDSNPKRKSKKAPEKEKPKEDEEEEEEEGGEEEDEEVGSHDERADEDAEE